MLSHERHDSPRGPCASVCTPVIRVISLPTRPKVRAGGRCRSEEEGKICAENIASSQLVAMEPSCMATLLWPHRQRTIQVGGIGYSCTCGYVRNRCTKGARGGFHDVLPGFGLPSCSWPVSNVPHRTVGPLPLNIRYGRRSTNTAIEHAISLKRGPNSLG